MPKCFMLVGVPASGKSFYMQNILLKKFPSAVVASTDNYVDKCAKQAGKTYSEVFQAVMPDAVRSMASTVRRAIENNQDIIWDQTSTTRAARAKKFRMLPDSYEVIGVVFSTPNRTELAHRLNSRPGKIIPDHVMQGMINQWEEPTESEGFSKIIYVG